jgi:RNA-splicing ligase RtcB
MSRKHALERINKAMHECVPMGTSIHAEPVISREQVDNAMREAEEEWQRFCGAYRNVFGVNLLLQQHADAPPVETESLSLPWLERRCVELGISFQKVMRSLCTLGGGNHFLELDERKDPPTAQEAGINSTDDGPAAEDLPGYLLVVHSGSRALGQAIYRFWVTSRRRERQLALMKGSTEEVAATQAPPPSDTDGGEKEEPVDDDDAEAASTNFAGDVALTEQADVAAYYKDVIVAQRLAQLNRTAMLSAVLHCVSRQDDAEVFSLTSIISSVHNYIDFSDMVVRKGAIPAREGALGIVALNMRDGVYLVRGKGNAEWNSSAAHGCGRLAPRGSLSGRHGGKSGRTKQDTFFALKKFQEEMKGVALFDEAVDERPSAYRDPTIVREMLEGCAGGTVHVLAQYKTVVNAKGF